MIQTAPQLNSIVDQDGAVILNGPRCQITTLDAMGGYIWRQIEQGKTKEEIVCHLVAETATDIQTVERDVQEFLADLASRALIQDVAAAQRRSEDQ
ncbi:PqqD family protein [Granulicella sp. L60]|uniref:PqqD family protein n=1 Tax=Granulicella sp. L60 TaxID=1641866 RepID=UPI00131E0BAA|nr:PqqD family protein [Granulicella sp. L60]